jgi:hypothetical protein
MLTPVSRRSIGDALEIGGPGRRFDRRQGLRGEGGAALHLAGEAGFVGVADHALGPVEFADEVLELRRRNRTADRRATKTLLALT